MKIEVIFIALLLVLCFSFADRKAAKFIVETVAQRSDIIEYKKIGTSSFLELFGEISKAKCTIVCLREDN